MPKGKGMGDLPGTHDMGHDQQRAADKNDSDHADAWSKHNQGAAKKVPPAQQKSYAAELGEAMAPYASEQGGKIRA